MRSDACPSAPAREPDRVPQTREHRHLLPVYRSATSRLFLATLLAIAPAPVHRRLIQAHTPRALADVSFVVRNG